MAKNKIIYGGEVLIDLTQDTVTAADLAEGVTAHDKSGAVITGTNTYDSDTSDDTAAVCRVTFNVPVSATATFTFTNYSEQGYDFGVFGELDTALNHNY